MDRFPRPFLACGLGLLLASSGCRSTQPEVPPGRAYAKDGQPKPAIQFSSAPHGPAPQGTAPYMPNNLGGSDIASGINAGSRPDPTNFGAPAGNYGPPGSSGAPNLSDPSTVRTSAAPGSTVPLTGTPPAGAPLGLPPLGPAPSADPNSSQPRDAEPVPSQTILPPLETPGVMGSPNALPSPM